MVPKLFDIVVAKMQAAKIPCSVALSKTDNSVSVELGMWYPDEAADDVFEALGDTKEVSVCAEVSPAWRQHVNGGPKGKNYLKRK